MLEEPEFGVEKELEDAVALAIPRLLGNKDEAVVLRGFGLDIAVFAKKGDHRSLHLLEVKAFSPDHGRCGIGDRKGGNQVRILFDQGRGQLRSLSELGVFHHSIRWVLGDRSKPKGSARFLFFTCEDAQAAASNGVAIGKQNNLRLSYFQDRWITWPQLAEEIAAFLRVA